MRICDMPAGTWFTYEEADTKVVGRVLQMLDPCLGERQINIVYYLQGYNGWNIQESQKIQAEVITEGDVVLTFKGGVC
jgi:hypothetical protein